MLGSGLELLVNLLHVSPKQGWLCLSSAEAESRFSTESFLSVGQPSVNRGM